MSKVYRWYSPFHCDIAGQRLINTKSNYHAIMDNDKILLWYSRPIFGLTFKLKYLECHIQALSDTKCAVIAKIKYSIGVKILYGLIAMLAILVLILNIKLTASVGFYIYEMITIVFVMGGLILVLQLYITLLNGNKYLLLNYINKTLLTQFTAS